MINPTPIRLDTACIATKDTESCVHKRGYLLFVAESKQKGPVNSGVRTFLATVAMPARTATSTTLSPTYAYTSY
jgi:hypothetical protein